MAKKIISNYEGSHNIRLNQTSKNKCTLGHFFDVVDLASGELLVLAAGDDISKPDRVIKTVKTWKENAVVGVFSNYERIDEKGVVYSKFYNPSGRSSLLTNVFSSKNGIDIHGASSAYDMSFLKSLPRVEGRYFFEDAFMTFMINIFGEKISKIDEPLVLYRTHSDSISNTKLVQYSASSIQLTEKAASDYAFNKHGLYVALKEMALSISIDNINDLFSYLELDNYIDKLRLKALWIDYSSLKRFSYVNKYRNDKDFIKWLIPRVLGVEVFSICKLAKVNLG